MRHKAGRMMGVLLVALSSLMASPAIAEQFTLRVEVGWKWLLFYGHSYCYAEALDRNGNRVSVDGITCWLRVEKSDPSVGTLYATLEGSSRNSDYAIVRDYRGGFPLPVVLGPAVGWACAENSGRRVCTGEVKN